MQQRAPSSKKTTGRRDPLRLRDLDGRFARLGAIRNAGAPGNPPMDMTSGRTNPGRWTENAIGWMPVPIGAATGFRVNGRDIPAVPMATSERTVVAAASYAAKLCGEIGGFSTTVDGNVVTGQIFYSNITRGRATEIAKEINSRSADFLVKLGEIADPMRKHGGGLCAIRASGIPGAGEGMLLVEFDFDVCEAMGSAVVTEMAEAYAEVFSSCIGLRRTAAICTNAKQGPNVEVRGYWRITSLGGEHIVRSMLDLYTFACRNEDRAVTHNKGVMNGVLAVATATGQDVPAIAVAMSRTATRNGRINPLTSLTRFGDTLEANMTLRLPLGTKGGATAYPVAEYARRMMGAETVADLAAIVASVGLAQNVAALRCLADEGIATAFRRPRTK